ncbi:MAG: acyltransferase, partial [Sphaerochaeta sp.]|nr:acyltransferase [Sphaerochaeta sp.]
MKSITAASVQFNHKPDDKAYNLSVIEKFVREASLKNVDLIIFPEMCITGYWHVRNLSELEVRNLAESVPAGPSSQTLIALAIKHQISIGAGLIEISEEGDL